MQRFVFYFLPTIMLLASMACSLGTVGVDDQESTPSIEMPPTATLPETVEIPAIPTTSAPAGGFVTGTPIDVVNLPTLKGWGGGFGYMPCYVESTEPSITSPGFSIYPYRSLCLNNFPTAAGSPDFTVTLTDPAGRSFSEVFTYFQDEIRNSRGVDAGNIQHSSDFDEPATPGVSMEVYMPSNVPCGDWLVSASTSDGGINVRPTVLTLECATPLLSVLPDLSTNPFISPVYDWEGPTFHNGETIHIVGTAHLSNTALIIAFYQFDPSVGLSEDGEMLGAANYGTTIMTDGSGNFQADFIVSSATLRGAYYALAAPAITPDMRLYHFGTRFSIE